MTKPSTVTIFVLALLAPGCSADGSRVVCTLKERADSGCSAAAAGTPARVPYTADYYFFSTR